MAWRKVTFSRAQGLVAGFMRRVPPRELSRYVARAVAEKMKESERLLALAGVAANRDRKLRAIEKEFEALSDEATDPWEDQ